MAATLGFSITNVKSNTSELLAGYSMGFSTTIPEILLQRKFSQIGSYDYILPDPICVNVPTRFNGIYYACM